TAFFASAFAPDASLAVPTASLRARLNASIAQLEAGSAAETRESSGWSFGALVASLSGLFAFTPQRAAALAGVAAVVVLFVSVFYIDRPGVKEEGRSEIAVADGPDGGPVPQPTKSPDNPPASPNTPPGVAGSRGATGGGPKPKGDAPKRRGTPFTPVPARKLEQKFNQQFVPGEKEYQSTIANLDKTIKTSGDSILKPSVRADYERNIAVLDRAIEETRAVALKNPKDKDAARFLLTAYKSKVELMTTVADSAQVATLDR
ncbi:MAG TPA: hypothetical protein VE360_09590, partial [Pyrinomonadaceae bacterium]|nr:hypothetical protein [Pyrinomonadaceae bacterium]